MTMWLLKNSFNYQVLVAPNLSGHIISDLYAQMVGGLGFGCSANIGDDWRFSSRRTVLRPSTRACTR